MKPNSLDYWRNYFRMTNRDVFDIIDGAIMVAASDCPQVFKVRRDWIAERLFSCRLALCLGCERVELVIPSEDVAVDRDDNDDDDGLMKSRIAGEVDDRGGNRGGKVNSTGSDGPGDLVTNHESKHSFRDAEALTDEIEEESQILEEVLRIKDIVTNYEEESESVLLESLRRLQLMSLTVGMLKGTGIGIAVNLLRKHRSKQITRLVQSLISVWKSTVDEWLQTTRDMPGGTPDSVNPSTVVDEEEEGLPSPPLDEGAFLAAQPSSMELSRFFDGVDDDGNPRGTGALLKKSGNGRKLTQLNLNRNGIDQRMEKRSNEVKIPVMDNKSQPLKKETVVVELNRLSNGNSEHMRLSNPNADGKINQVSKPRPLPRILEKPAITMKGWSSGHQQDDSKFIDKGAAAQMKLEATKRKLHERYQQAENAKKQRTVQVMDLHDLPKQAGNHRNSPGRPGNHNRQGANGRR